MLYRSPPFNVTRTFGGTVWAPPAFATGAVPAQDVGTLLLGHGERGPTRVPAEAVYPPHARKGKIEELQSKGTARVITGLSPLSGMFGYSTELRSATQGRGTFTMQFDHFGQSEK